MTEDEKIIVYNRTDRPMADALDGVKISLQIGRKCKNNTEYCPLYFKDGMIVKVRTEKFCTTFMVEEKLE